MEEKTKDFYSCGINAMYSQDEDGKLSLEISYNDSKGLNGGAYAENDDPQMLMQEVYAKLLDSIEESAHPKEEEEKDELTYLMSEVERLKEENAILQNTLNEIRTQTVEDKKNYKESYQSDSIKPLSQIEVLDPFAIYAILENFFK